MKKSLRSLVFRYMLGVIAVTAILRLGLWLAYQAYEVRQGHLVFHEQINEMLLLLLVEVLSLSILGFMLWHLSRMLLSPLRSVANAAQLIAQGHLDKRIRTQHLPKGELHDIADALNASFDQYQRAIDRISRFSSAASHQLRTPIAGIRNTAELSLAHQGEEAKHEQALESILEDTDHLTHMTEQLLLLSRMETDHLRKNFSELDLTDVTRRVLEVYQPILESKKISLHLDLEDTSPVYGDETLIMEAIMNLVDNATNWTPSGGDITVTTCGNGISTFLISDSGPGVDPAFRDQLFERFSRHASTSYKGSGLGLSIVNEVVRVHDGRIEVGAGEHGGALFHLFLPSSDCPA